VIDIYIILLLRVKKLLYREKKICRSIWPPINSAMPINPLKKTKITLEASLANLVKKEKDVLIQCFE
jgi:hypothetical protein